MAYKEFDVWVDCQTLGSFETLEKAVNAAPQLIANYAKDYGTDWDKDESPKIFEYDYFFALGVRYDNLLREYEIDGTLKIDYLDYALKHKEEIGKL